MESLPLKNIPGPQPSGFQGRTHMLTSGRAEGSLSNIQGFHGVRIRLFFFLRGEKLGMILKVKDPKTLVVEMVRCTFVEFFFLVS